MMRSTQNRMSVGFLIMLGLVSMFGCKPGSGPPIGADDTNSSVATASDGPDADAGETDSQADTDGFENTVCGDIAVRASLSENIPTVGIVTWSTSLEKLSGAVIAFGRDGVVEYTAPVDLGAPEYRTVLLGMKPSSTYEFQVIAKVGDAICASPRSTLETGPLATRLPIPEISVAVPQAVSGEFIVTSVLTRPVIFILDRDGEVVWWYNFGDSDYDGPELLGFSRAHMSFDGRQMWGGNINFGRGNGRLYRVDMDGSNEAEPEITYHHHDFAVLPGNRLALLEFDEDVTGTGQGTCDRITERSSDGTTEVVYPLRDGLSYLADQTEWCQSNAIHYVPAEDVYYVSVLEQNMVVKIHRAERRIEWILDGDDPEKSDFVGVSWRVQHGFHPLDDGNLLLFMNGDAATGFPEPSLIAKLSLDGVQHTATADWQYQSDINCPMLGDVQCLSNGNTLVTYSTAGVFHEVDNQHRLVRQITFATEDVVGYADARKSLYGPPDRY